MKITFVVLILILKCSCQVSPIWSESPRVETRNIQLISNHLSVTQTFYWNNTYQKTFTANPYVALSIVNLRTATYAGSIGILSYLSNTNSQTQFENRVDVFSPTQVWYLQVRFIAYDGSFVQLNDITMTYKLYKKTGSPAGQQLNTVSANPGTYRFDSLNTGLSVVTTNQFAIAIFATGFIGTINSSFFQANLTQDIQAGGSLKVKVTVGPDTLLEQIAVYVLNADLTKLSLSCWTFVQSAITQARNGTQYSFYVYSEVLYDKNYISGLRSFYIVNNQMYNFTIYGQNFTTFGNSYYNDVSHFNIWVRVCPSPYNYFNKLDFKCYAFCPSGTYLILADALCVACDYTCSTCSSASTCDICGTNRVKNAAGACVCKDYYYQYNQVCVPCHYTCLTCQYPAQYVNCDSCDAAMHRNLDGASNTTCNCTAGYSDVGSALCDEICGDGIINSDPCDDGNAIGDDGCSGTCQIQTYFTCTGNPSQCFYIGNISINVIRIQKDPHQNFASFFIQLSPFVPLMYKLTLDNIMTNITTSAERSIYLDGNVLIYNISYTSDLEGLPITIGFKPTLTGPFSLFYPLNVTLTATASNGLGLYAYGTDDYSQSDEIGNAAYIIGLVFLGLFILFCYGDWKELGLQLFFALQLSFMSFMGLNFLNPHTFKTGLIKNVMGWNNVTGQILPPYIPKAPVMQQLGYSVGFISNFNIMVILPGIALILYFGYRLALYLHQRKRKNGVTSLDFDQTLEGKFFIYFKFDLFVYWMLFNMQQILVATVTQSQYVQNGAIFVYIVVLLAAIVVCIVGLFIRPNALAAYRKNLFHKTYGNKTFLIVLVSTLLMDILLLLCILVKRQIFYALFAFPVMIIIYLIARRPFKMMGNNIRLIIIQCCLIVVLALQVVIMNTAYSVHRDYVIGIIVCMCVMVLTTFICWVYDLVVKIIKWRRKDLYDQKSSKYSSKKEQQQINEKVKQAGYELMYGAQRSAKTPTNYQMSRFRQANSSMPRPPIQKLRPVQTPRKPSNLRDINTDKEGERAIAIKKPSSNIKKNEEQDYDTSENPTQKNKRYTKKKEQSLPAREDTIQKIGNSTSRRRTNAYQQVLEETAGQRYGR